MSNPLLAGAMATAAIGSGLIAGFFFAFSAVVMKALGRLQPKEGTAAMNAINVVVLNAWFFTAFFGTGAVCAVLATWALLNRSDPGALYALAGGVFYLVGVIGVTIARNVPLNHALAAAEPDGAEGARFWLRYLSVWTAWNHVRTAAPLAASAAFVMALCQMVSTRPL